MTGKGAAAAAAACHSCQSADPMNEREVILLINSGEGTRYYSYRWCGDIYWRAVEFQKFDSVS